LTSIILISAANVSIILFYISRFGDFVHVLLMIHDNSFAAKFVGYYTNTSYAAK